MSSVTEVIVIITYHHWPPPKSLGVSIDLFTKKRCVSVLGRVIYYFSITLQEIIIGRTTLSGTNDLLPKGFKYKIGKFKLELNKYLKCH